jgi:general L-amino acid transport system substrate-binding protein
MRLVNRKLYDFATLALATLVLIELAALPASAEPTLETVKNRGGLVCGVDGRLPGFSFTDERKEWQGLDVDLCRAIAAAVLGDARKVTFVPLSTEGRFRALAAGEVDVLARNTTVTLQRSTDEKLTYAAINYFDGQAFLVSNKIGVKLLTSLGGATICFTRNTTHEASMVNWFRSRRLSLTPLGFGTQDAMYDAFFASRCAAATQDATALAAAVVRRGKSADYSVLPQLISKEPLGPFVRTGDEAWLDVVRWSHYAMLEAEERGITRINVDEERRSTDANVRLLLGVASGNGKALGLDDDWVYNIIKQVGNYGESFDRHLGARSPFKLPRGANALWSQGGLMYPPPMR